MNLFRTFLRERLTLTLARGILENKFFSACGAFASVFRALRNEARTPIEIRDRQVKATNHAV